MSFWPLDAASGAVVFTGTSARPYSYTQQAPHLRAWLTGACSTWEEWQSGNDSTLLFRGQLVGMHAGVVLSFTLRATIRPAGLRYQLSGFRVGAPTGQGLVQWSSLHRLFDEVDFRPELTSFQQQLQRALPAL